MSAGSPSQAGDRHSGGPELPVERLRAGYYTDAYFNNARAVLEADGHHPHVLMQVFQRQRSELGGMDEALDCLRAGAARRRSDGGWSPAWEELEVRALPEGASLEPWETVLTIEGDYALFAHTETVYLGCLARGTRIRTNVARAVAAARGKEVLYFAARHDHYLVQASDGFAALAAGAAGITTDAQGSRLGARGLGTVPHGLIAAYAGDTARAAEAFATHLPDESRLTVLVDFENDSITTALETAERLGDRLWGVRLDTADRSSTGRSRATRRPKRGAKALPLSSSAAFAPRWTMPVTSGSGSLFPAASMRTASPPSKGRASRWTSTAWAHRCFGVRTTSPPTWSEWMGGDAPRLVVRSALIRDSRRCPDPLFDGALG